MLKYYVALFLAAAAVLFYVYVEDPCNRQFRLEFSTRYPDYTILDTGADEGSKESVQCRVYYRKPDSTQMYEDVWLYKKSGDSWKFSRIAESHRRETMP